MEIIPTRILIIDTAWLGDVLFTTALIGAVRDAWPKSEIHLVTAPRAQELVHHHPHLNGIRVFDKAGREGSAFALKKLAAELNSIQFDVVLCAHPSFRSRLLCTMLSAPVRVGHPGLLASRAFTHIVHNDLALEPDHVERRLNLLRAVRPGSSASPLKVGVLAEEQTWAKTFLNNKCGQAQSVLALIPGSARRTKQWPAERFVEVGMQWLDRRTHGHVLVFLGPGEPHLTSFFGAVHDPRFTIVEESLRNCAALLNRCDVAVGNDTGVSFLALAAGCRKVIVLYGSTQVNYGFPSPHKAIAAGVPCCLSRTGHGEKTCKWTKGQPWCMSEISVAKVLNNILEEPNTEY